MFGKDPNLDLISNARCRTRVRGAPELFSVDPDRGQIVQNSGKRGTRIFFGKDLNLDLTGLVRWCRTGVRGCPDHFKDPNSDLVWPDGAKLG